MDKKETKNNYVPISPYYNFKHKEPREYQCITLKQTLHFVVIIAALALVVSYFTA